MSRRGYLTITAIHQAGNDRNGKPIRADIPAGAKLPPLRRMPAYKPLNDEYAGLVFDHAAIRAKIEEHPNMYPTFQCLRHARPGPWLILSRETKSSLIFRVVKINPDGTLGKLGETMWIERPLLAMCPNLAEHIKAAGLDRIRL